MPLKPASEPATHTRIIESHKYLLILVAVGAVDATTDLAIGIRNTTSVARVS